MEGSDWVAIIVSALLATASWYREARRTIDQREADKQTRQEERARGERARVVDQARSFVDEFEEEFNSPVQYVAAIREGRPAIIYTSPEIVASRALHLMNLNSRLRSMLFSLDAGAELLNSVANLTKFYTVAVDCLDDSSSQLPTMEEFQQASGSIRKEIRLLSVV